MDKLFLVVEKTKPDLQLVQTGVYKERGYYETRALRIRVERFVFGNSS